MLASCPWTLDHSEPSFRGAIVRPSQTRYKLALWSNISLAPTLSSDQGGGHVDVALERLCEQPTFGFFHSPSTGLPEEYRFRAPRCNLG